MNIKWVCIVSGVILLFAILPLPADFYYPLRWVIFISSLIIAFRLYESKFQYWSLAIGAIAFIFNPIFPIYIYAKSSWIVIDFISAIIFFITPFKTEK